LFFPFYIAKRYFFSKRSHNIINVISVISIVGITIGTMALIIVLSVFNGFEGLVVSLFSSFNPDIEITVKEGKTFNSQEIQCKKIKKIPKIAYYTEIVEENVLLKYKSKQYIATIKGVGKNYQKMTRLDTMLIDGAFVLEQGKKNYAVVGQGAAYYLDINLNDFYNTISVYVPKRSKSVILSPLRAFNNENILTSGIFSIQQDIDLKYIIVPIRFARKLLDYTTEVTSVEIGLSPDADKDEVQQQIQKIVGNKFLVKNHFQQQELLYKIMKSEKMAVFLILGFILLIATFNVVGSLTMLILDKRKDISFLWSMGADSKLIKKIFLIEGLLISLSGTLLGLILGGIICWIQEKYGIIGIHGESFILTSYPVNMQIMDFIYVLLIEFIIALVATWYPVRQISRKYLYKNLTFNKR